MPSMAPLVVLGARARAHGPRRCGCALHLLSLSSGGIDVASYTVFTHRPAGETMNETASTRSAAEARVLETAARCLPGGVLGSTRFADDQAFIVKSGRGSKVHDLSGREYIDYLLGSGPLVLGHAHPAVVALADEICRAVPCAEQVRFTVSGTEATFFALRAARAFRKRDTIMKFEG